MTGDKIKEARRPFAESALDYLVCGWSGVFPLKPNQKSPPPDGRTGHHGVDAEPPQITDWLEECPDGNIGVRMPEDVIGIDVDNYDSKTGGATLDQLEARLGTLPLTSISTARDGISGIRFYRVPKGRKWKGDVGKDIEVIQHVHRYAVVWPSVHPSGQQYRWSGGKIPFAIELPELPKAWVDYLTEQETYTTPPAPGEYDESELLTDGLPCKSICKPLDRYRMKMMNGARHDAMNSTVLDIVRQGEQGHQGSRDALRQLRELFTLDIGNSRNGTDEEFDRSLHGALGTVAIRRTAEDKKGCCGPRVKPERTSEDRSLLAGLRNGAWLDAQEFAPLREVVPGLIPEGLTLLVGGPKIGKSWLCQGVALAVAGGGSVLGSIRADRKRPVLLLALEDGDRRLQDRFRTLLGDSSIPSHLDYMTQIEHGEVVETIRTWLATIGSEVEPLVILDTLGKVMPDARNGESAYQRDYRAAGELKRVTDDHPGMALLVLHHDRKAVAEDFVSSVSGTNGIAGAADTIIVLTRPRNQQQGLLKVTGRDVVEGEYGVITDNGTWSLIGNSLEEAAAAAEVLRTTDGLADRSSDVVEFVNENPDGVRASDVAGAIGMDAKDASTYLLRLFKSGRIKRAKRGLYVPTVGSVGSVGSDESVEPTVPTHSRDIVRGPHLKRPHSTK